MLSNATKHASPRIAHNHYPVKPSKQLLLRQRTFKHKFHRKFEKEMPYYGLDAHQETGEGLEGADAHGTKLFSLAWIPAFSATRSGTC
ncbi:hypothetical protein Tco_1265296 [Tanacetum coccineum]